jgi:argininosuccinate lyase
MSLWQKDNQVPGSHAEAIQKVAQFTVGHDREMDSLLAAYDVQGSLAHIEMLQSVGLLTMGELSALKEGLKKIYVEIRDNRFVLDDGVEDIHSQVEIMLTRSLGEAGKKIHSARSRNDQVLVDIKLFLRSELEDLVKAIMPFFDLLQEHSERFKDDLLPGYTHLQLAMPSSFGLWFGAYAESLVDDMITLKGAYDVVNKNPLGSAAGYGSGFPIDRGLTTRLLGFADLNYNVVYAQMGRGKSERIVAQALSNVADTLAKLSMDACLYLNQNFGFISFPDEFTTGSSIMPHKKNPDVFELIRAHCNRIKALPNEIMLMTTNLPSGYHRDLQLLKEHLFPAFAALKDCIAMASLMFNNIVIKKDILTDPKYRYLFSVEEVNKLVVEGTPFRDAYKKIASNIEADAFEYNPSLHHTHEGSIGNLSNNEIREQMEKLIASFPFLSVETAIEKLIND